MAMQRRSSFRRPGIRRPRRKLIWARHAFGVVVGVGGTFSSFPLGILEAQYGAQLIGATIMRVRGVITCTITNSIPPTAQAYAAIRIGLRVTDHADLAPQDYGVGAMYGNQAHADWFMFEPFMLDNAGVATLDEEVDTTAASEIRHIDVRARRKIEELDQTVEMLIGAPAPGSTNPPESTAQVRVRGDLSLLVALP